MGMVTLQAALQVIKLQSPDQHLNLDRVEFSLAGADGGVISGGSGNDGGHTWRTAGAHLNAVSKSSKGCSVALAIKRTLEPPAWPIVVSRAAFLAVSRRSRH